jgi:hypothetical protein
MGFYNWFHTCKGQPIGDEYRHLKTAVNFIGDVSVVCVYILFAKKVQGTPSEQTYYMQNTGGCVYF